MIGLQEVVGHQLNDIITYLNNLPENSSIFSGTTNRDDFVYDWMGICVICFLLPLVLTAEIVIVGVGREDGKFSGEFSPIVYRKDKLKVWLPYH